MRQWLLPISQNKPCGESGRLESLFCHHFPFLWFLSLKRPAQHQRDLFWELVCVFLPQIVAWGPPQDYAQTEMWTWNIGCVCDSLWCYVYIHITCVHTVSMSSYTWMSEGLRNSLIKDTMIQSSRNSHSLPKFCSPSTEGILPGVACRTTCYFTTLALTDAPSQGW